MSRKEKVSRKTKETSISVDLNIDGKGHNVIESEGDAYIVMNTNLRLGMRYRVSYHGILAVELRYSTLGGDTMDGILETAPNIVLDNDKYWGVMFSYSFAIL